MSEVATIENTDIVPQQERSVTPMDLLDRAMQRGVDADQLNKLMELQQRWEADQARKAFVKAMAAFKSEPLTVEKKKQVEYSGTKYSHATLAQVCDAVVSALSKHGLSHRWETNQDGGAISVSCVITHDLGHSERVTLSAPPDDSGKKNRIQQIASTVTYLERYTLMAATGLAAKDMDNDGRSAKDEEAITAEQVANLEALISETGADKAKYLAFLKIEALDDMPAKSYDAAVKWLEAKRKRGSQ